MTIERTVDVAAPPAAVFDVIADPSIHPIWRPSCEEFRSEDGGPLHKGSKLIETVRFLGRRYRTTYLVTELEPHRLFSIATNEGPIELTLHAHLTRVPHGTRLTFVVEAEIPPPTRWLLALYLGSEARRLKRLVERDRPTQSPTAA